MEDDFERVICVKGEVHVFNIPPRQSSRGYRAADWKLDQPAWTGRLRIVNKNDRCIVKLEDRFSGELFAQAPIDQYPGPSVESVTDSSRYFVLKIVDDSGRHAFIGMGFTDRGDSFDFNVSLQDHFKREKTVENIMKEETTPQKHLDLGFKEGQTIKINFGNKTESKPKSKTASGNVGLLPPPPGGVAAPPKLTPPRSNASPSPISQFQQNQPLQESLQQTTQSSSNEWSDFSSFSNNSSSSNLNLQSSGGNWVQF